MPRHQAEFRFYEELNDFLPAAGRKAAIPYAFHGHPAVKDSIEALGVPHSEVDLIVVNGESVGFDYQLQPGDRVAVYPCFEALATGVAQHSIRRRGRIPLPPTWEGPRHRCPPSKSRPASQRS